MLSEKIQENQQIIIERATPELDGGRYPVKRVVGANLVVEADIFRDGHDLISAALLYRSSAGGNAEDWEEVPMYKFNNDRWGAEFPLTSIGRWCYTIEAWTDRFGTWEHDMEKRVQAGQVLKSDVLEGVAIIEDTLTRIPTLAEA